MNKFLIIEGLVLGGHTISDLGITVPYKEEVILHSDRISWSRDLQQALEQKQVVKKRVVSGHELPSPTTRSQNAAPTRPLSKKYTTIPKTSETLVELSEASDARLKSEEENSRLREMNANLLEATSRLIRQQQELTDKLSEFMDRPPTIIGVPALSTTQRMTQEGVDDNTPTFIPSKIRTGKAVVTEVTEVQSNKQADTSEDALAALRKRKKK